MKHKILSFCVSSVWLRTASEGNDNNASVTDVFYLWEKTSQRCCPGNESSLRLLTVSFLSFWLHIIDVQSRSVVFFKAVGQGEAWSLSSGDAADTLVSAGLHYCNSLYVGADQLLEQNASVLLFNKNKKISLHNPSVGIYPPASCSLLGLIQTFYCWFLWFSVVWAQLILTVTSLFSH